MKMKLQQTKQEQVEPEKKNTKTFTRLYLMNIDNGGIQISWSWEEYCDLINKANTFPVISTQILDMCARAHTHTHTDRCQFLKIKFCCYPIIRESRLVLISLNELTVTLHKIGYKSREFRPRSQSSRTVGW